MHRFRISLILKVSILLLFTISLFAGCTAVKKEVLLSPGDLITQGKQQVKRKEFDNAENSFKQILEDHPDSKERVPALLFLANTHFLDSEYEEARFHYKKYIELYPAKKNVDHAYFYKALCDFRLIELATRDQTNSHSSLEGFEEFIKKFPKSSFYKRAVKKRNETLQVLAQNVFEIGKFYFRTGAYQSAILRLSSLRETYPDQEFLDEATFLIAESYLQEENYGKARENYLELLDKFPKSIYSEEARFRLKSIR